MILNVMKVFQSLVFTKEVDSINFKNAIIQLQQLPFELPGFEKDIEEMIIEEEFGNDYYGNLIIENYPNLKRIVVKKNSLKNLNSLKIRNCDKLMTIVTKDGDDLEDEGTPFEFNHCAFENVKNIIIESIYDYSMMIFLSS